MTAQFVTTKDRVACRAAASRRSRAVCVTSTVACALLLAGRPRISAPAQSASAAPPSASHSWQKIEMPSAAEVKAAWKNPPSEYGPEPYFGMNGPVTIESLAHDLDTMKALGFRAVTAQAGGGMNQTYLSPQYFAFFKQFVEEAKKRDMKVWIVDDIGYPSGFAGGLFAKDKHDLSMQALTLSQRIPVKAGATLDQAVGPNAVAAIAISASGERTPVPVTNGSIHFTAAADSTVAVVEHVFRTSPTKSDTNPTHQKDATQPLEDYLSPAATAAYIESTHDGYYKAMPELFGSTIMGFRGDEPDYSIAGLPWTPTFFDTFQKIKGYDIRPYLGALLLTQGGGRPRPGEATPTPPARLTDKELRAKGDYYDIFAQMFEDGFFKPQGIWCAAHSVEYQVHLNHEEMEMDLTRSEGDFERDMKYVEVPGIDAIWHQIWTDTISDYPRLAASAAHVYGHPRAFTESFAAYRPAPDIDQARYILNEQMVRGVNLIETMFYTATRPVSSETGPAGAAPEATPPAPASTQPLTPLNLANPGFVNATAPLPTRGGPSAVMRDPGWPALMDYIRRVSYLMSMGRPAASVALYLPSSSMWMNDRDADTAFVSTEQMLAERQIDFDIINLNALAADLHAGPGTLTTDSGNAYRTVIIPSASVLSEAELARLRAFAKGDGKTLGSRVLFLGRTPSLIYTKNILDARAAAPDDFSFATVETSAQLPPTPTPPAQAPASPPSPQFVPTAIEDALAQAIPTREIAFDTPDAPDPAVKVLTRRLRDANVYLFFNEGAQPAAHFVTLHTSGKIVESWDPATGAVTPMPSTAGKGAVTVKLNLQPYATQLLTIR